MHSTRLPTRPSGRTDRAPLAALAAAATLLALAPGAPLAAAPGDLAASALAGAAVPGAALRLAALPVTGAPAPSIPADAPVPEPRLPGPAPTADRDLPEALAGALGLGPPGPPPPGGKASHLTVLPFVLANPLMGFGGGAAVLGGFRLGPPGDTHFSSFETSVFATSQHQLGVALRSQVRLPADAWILVGDWGAGRFPNPAWGLGGSTSPEDRTVVRRSQLQLHETVYRRTTGHLYAGLGWFLDDFWDVHDTRAEAGLPSPYAAYPWGTGRRSVSSGLTLSVLWDGRDRPAAPTDGSYLLARYRFEPSLFGSDDDWRSVYLDARTYLRVPWRRSDVLALWAFEWSSFGKTPYLLLPSVGADPEHRSARGYTEGRYTAQDLVYAEAEYRAHLWQWVGAVAGVNLSMPSERGVSAGPLFRTVHPAVVAGLRLLLDRASGSNLTLDAAWSPGGGLALYLNANEAF